jgi:hypothetical protein
MSDSRGLILGLSLAGVIIGVPAAYFFLKPSTEPNIPSAELRGQFGGKIQKLKSKSASKKYIKHYKKQTKRKN